MIDRNKLNVFKDCLIVYIEFLQSFLSLNLFGRLIPVFNNGGLEHIIIKNIKMEFPLT